ncbi:hypothetical protein AGMMS50262_20870 [Bacteroidia bacterium]|nr:hypothetical protein AGMMS50262_20870 [Bacteroidia bacterium]
MNKKNIIFAFLAFFSILCFSQNSEVQPEALTIGEAINKMPVTATPFNATKSGSNARFTQSNTYGIYRYTAIPDKLYDNVQLTQYTNADDPELWGTTFRKFSILNSTNVLLVVSFGGATDWRTDVMCVVNPSGQILSTLEVVICVADIYVKQFRITAQNQIIVTSIKPTSTTSIPFATLKNFYGYRQDIAYSINAQGQFIQGSVQTYKSKTYTRSYLWDEDINLWEGGETLQ